MTNSAFLTATYQAAIRAGHPFPDITACEAALETQFGSSALATRAYNFFKLRPSPDYSFVHPRVKLFVPYSDPRTGRQYLSSTYWTEFCSPEDCIRERYEYLKFRSTWDAGITEALRLAELQATEEEGVGEKRDYSAEYIVALSKNIVGPANRADQVLAIREKYRAAFTAVN